MGKIFLLKYLFSWDISLLSQIWDIYIYIYIYARRELKKKKQILTMASKKNLA